MTELFLLIVFSLSCYGGAVGIAHSKLFQPLRYFLSYSNYYLDENDKLISAVHRTNSIFKFFGKLTSCTLCLGFWLGIIFSTFITSPCGLIRAYSPESFTLMSKAVTLIYDGFLGAASAFITHLLFRSRMEGA